MGKESRGNGFSNVPIPIHIATAPHRPGHGAPTGDIRKKKFTEHQLRRSQSVLSLGDTAGELVQLRTSYRDDMVLDPKVDTIKPR